MVWKSWVCQSIWLGKSEETLTCYFLFLAAGFEILSHFSSAGEEKKPDTLLTSWHLLTMTVSRNDYLSIYSAKRRFMFFVAIEFSIWYSRCWSSSFFTKQWPFHVVQQEKLQEEGEPLNMAYLNQVKRLYRNPNKSSIRHERSNIITTLLEYSSG